MQSGLRSPPGAANMCIVRKDNRGEKSLGEGNGGMPGSCLLMLQFCQ